MRSFESKMDNKRFESSQIRGTFRRGADGVLFLAQAKARRP